MANPDHVAVLRQGSTAWNAWRREHTKESIDLGGADLFFVDLTEADLSHAELSGADLRGARLVCANLYRARLKGADLFRADLSHANLTEANLDKANLYAANLFKANFTEAYLQEADLSEALLLEACLKGARLNAALLNDSELRGADLTRAELRNAVLHRARMGKADLTCAGCNAADLTEACLSGATLTDTVLCHANLTDCSMAGAILDHTGLWEATLNHVNISGAYIRDVRADEAKLSSLVITPQSYSEITVDNFDAALIIALCLENRNVRYLIDTCNMVLVLGCFPSERRFVTQAISQTLNPPIPRRAYPAGLPPEFSYATVVCDFRRRPSTVHNTVVFQLASKARFVIADLTDAASFLPELERIGEEFPTLPVQPILRMGAPEGLALKIATALEKYRSFLPLYEYPDSPEAIADCAERMVRPVERRSKMQRGELPRAQ